MDRHRTPPDPAGDETLNTLLLPAANGCSASSALLCARTHRRILGTVRHHAEAAEVLQEDVDVKTWSRSRRFDALAALQPALQPAR